MPKFDFSSLFSRRSAFVLILTNLVPLFGVLFLGWNISALVLIYWTENISVGFFNVLKMLMIGAYKKEAALLFMVPFFLFHYGFFTIIQGVFIFVFFGLPKSAVIVPAIVLFFGHGFSFFDNFFLKRAYETRELGKQMFAPYKRVAVMQAVVILGAFGIKLLSAPIIAVVVLVIAKMIVDLNAHSSEDVQ